MKTVLLVVTAMFCLALTGCFATEEDFEPELVEPRDYNQAMDWIRDEFESIDAHVIGGQYDAASREAYRARDFAKALGRFEPPRMANTYDVFIEYDRQAEDLYHATDRLLFFVEQRRKDEAKDQLIEVAKRFNRLSAEYGPGYQISVLERDPELYTLRDFDPSDVPGELSGNR